MTQKVQRANMDGTAVEDIVSQDLMNPSGILLDFENDVMYFGDSYSDYIGKSNLDGDDVEVFLNQEGAIFRLEFNLAQDRIFFTNIDFGKIYSCDLDGLDIQTEMNVNESGPTGFVFYSHPVQTSIINIESTQLINIYPNPASTELCVELIDNNEKPMEMIELINPDGKLVKQIRTNLRKNIIDTSSLPSGSYYLRVTLANKKISTQPIILF